MTAASEHNVLLKLFFSISISAPLRKLGSLFVPYNSCLIVLPCEQQNGAHRDQNERAANGAGKEDIKAALRDDHGPAEVLLRQRAQDNAQQDGNQLEVHTAQEVGHDAKNQNDINIIYPVVGGVGAQAMQKVSTMGARIS